MEVMRDFTGAEGWQGLLCDEMPLLPLPTPTHAKATFWPVVKYTIPFVIGTSVAGGIMWQPLGTSPAVEFRGTASERFEALLGGYDFFSCASGALALSPVDQIREIQEALAMNRSQLAEVLRVTRPTLYNWLEGAELNDHNATRLRRLYDLTQNAGINSKDTLNSRFLRLPMTPGGRSVLSVLTEEKWDETTLLRLLKEAKFRSRKESEDRASAKRTEEAAGFHELSEPERKMQLASNVTLMMVDDPYVP